MSLQQSYSALRFEVNESQDLQGQFLEPNLALLKDRAQQFAVEQKKKMQEAYKAVFDKNKQISDLFNKNTELTTLNNQL